jgi:DNA modification methylase
VHCVVTSPPYWGLRDYGVAGQIGLEADFADYLEAIARVFVEVRRVLRDDGTAWVNLGDTYASDSWGGSLGAVTLEGSRRNLDASRNARTQARIPAGLKPKDMIGMPWRIAFRLQADGWYLRSDIVWAKPNPMPESVKDRPTKAHEYVFLLSKSERYWSDFTSIREPQDQQRPPAQRPLAATDANRDGVRGWKTGSGKHSTIEHARAPRRNGNKERRLGSPGRTNDHRGTSFPWIDGDGLRNVRTVWTIETDPFRDAHFATFPRRLVERCIKAGCPAGGTVLDPFLGSGTTAQVAVELGRRAVGCELSPEYVAMARRRLEAAVPLFTRSAAP